MSQAGIFSTGGGGGGSITSVDTDLGTATPVAGILNIVANDGANNTGATVSFSGTSNTVLLNVTDATFNTIVGKNAGNATITGIDNTSLGPVSLFSLTTGSGNVALGNACLTSLTSGIYNVVVGGAAGSNYLSNESSNILIGHDVGGTTGESNTLRIGNGTGTGNGSLSQCFISGIKNVNVGSVATVVTQLNDQLGTADITAGTGITVTTGANTITIASSGVLPLAYTNVNSSPYTVLTTDDYLSVDCSGGAITVRLPNAATSGKTFVVKDRTGSAATNNITVTTVGGAINIDGATTFVMNTAYQAISLIGNGSTYEIY